MIRDAKLIDILGAPQEVVDSFWDVVEANGNPFYHRWRIEDPDKWVKPEKAKRINIINSWLKELGLTKENIIIITGGW